MLRTLRGGTSRPETQTADADWRLPADVIWIDLLNPTKAEELACEAALSIALPTREEMAEIELSSRLYREDHVLFMTAEVLANSDDVPVEGPITFVLAANHLVTIRYIDPKAFSMFEARMSRNLEECQTAAQVFVGLVDAIIDRAADILERASADVEALSTQIFSQPRKLDFRAVMRGLGRAQNLNAKLRDSLISLSRLMGFASIGGPLEHDPERREHLALLQRDIVSLTDHSTYLGGNITFLLDAALGLINIEQNGIIKFFSVAAVVFMPPTLVASYFGMNFKHMVEFDWAGGEAFAVALMVVSIVAPLLWFRRKGWL